MDWPSEINNISLTLFDQVEAIRKKVTQYEARVILNNQSPEWGYHLRGSRNALRLAQVHLHQLTGVAAHPALSGQDLYCFDNECDMKQIRTGVGINLVLTWIVAILIICAVLGYSYKRLGAQGELTSMSPDPSASPPPPSYSACYQDEEEGNPQPSGAQANSDPRAVEWLVVQHEQTLKLDKILSLYTTSLTHVTKFSKHAKEQHDERLEELTALRRENSNLKTDLTLIKQRADDAQIKYYSVSLIPRMLGAHGETVQERLRNCIFRNFTFPEARPQVIEKELGIPIPPDWILTTEAADEFIQAHFPGLGSRLSWELGPLPGVNLTGADRFKQLIQGRHLRQSERDSTSGHPTEPEADNGAGREKGQEAAQNQQGKADQDDHDGRSHDHDDQPARPETPREADEDDAGGEREKPETESDLR